MQMPDGLSFDELNKYYVKKTNGNLRSMPYEQYFGEMDLSQEQVRHRIDTAKDIEEFMRLAIASMYLELQGGSLGYLGVADEIRTEYQRVLDRLGTPLTESFSQTHVDNTAMEIVLATMGHTDAPYFFSNDRARLIAENEANSIWNDSEYEDAIRTRKTRKRWSAIIDKKTRDTHKDVNGTTIPIAEPFLVGDSLMLFPKDTSLGASAEEIANCRCSVSYF